MILLMQKLDSEGVRMQELLPRWRFGLVSDTSSAEHIHQRCRRLGQSVLMDDCPTSALQRCRVGRCVPVISQRGA